MDIMPFISEIVNLFYDFDDVEGLYSNNTLMLVQGIIKGYELVNSIAKENLVSHTKLTRFLRGHKGVWDTFKMKFQKQMFEETEDIFIADADPALFLQKVHESVRRFLILSTGNTQGRK